MSLARTLYLSLALAIIPASDSIAHIVERVPASSLYCTELGLRKCTDRRPVLYKVGSFLHLFEQPCWSCVSDLGGVSDSVMREKLIDAGSNGIEL